MTENLRHILKKLNLLYVEDNKKLLLEVKNVFGPIFLNIFTAPNGEKALEILENEKIDLIITDLQMPKIGGIELIKEIRTKDKNISIIILTAHADKDLLLEASNLQIDGYLTKPINLDKISNALTNAVERSNYSIKYTFKDGTIYDATTKSVYKENELPLELGNKESLLLDLLLKNSNKITTKDEIYYTVWDMQNKTESALKNLLLNLRTKIGKDNIVNYPGKGWKLQEML